MGVAEHVERTVPDDRFVDQNDLFVDLLSAIHGAPDSLKCIQGLAAKGGVHRTVCLWRARHAANFCAQRKPMPEEIAQCSYSRLRDEPRKNDDGLPRIGDVLTHGGIERVLIEYAKGRRVLIELHFADETAQIVLYRSQAEQVRARDDTAAPLHATEHIP
jgi:hypothetical protein